MQGADAGAINAKLKAQASSRVTVVLDRADAARKDGARKARKATGAGGKAEVARLRGMVQTWAAVRGRWNSAAKVPALVFSVSVMVSNSSRSAPASTSPLMASS